MRLKTILMATIQCFEDLEIWQLARAFAKSVYQLYTKNECFSKDYKLKNQIIMVQADQ